MREKLTPAFVRDAPKPAKGDRIVYWDKALPGFGLMVTAKGHKSFLVSYRAGGHKRKMHLKAGLGLTDARREAKAIQGRVAKGGDPLGERQKAERAKGETLKAIVEEYISKDGASLRSIGERRRLLHRLVLPVLGGRQIEDIARSDVARLLDRIVKENGPVAADNALAYLRRIMSWHAARSDTFRSPIVRGMSRTRPNQRRRQRVLTDDELRALWQVTEAPSAFSCFLRFLLLTAVRRNEAAGMRRNEVSGKEWTVPAERCKTGLELVIPLSPTAQSVLDKVPKVGKSGFVFTTDGQHQISGFSKFKAAFDERMLTELRRQNPDAIVPNWRLHDVRRTARSLMGRAGVPTDHAERCLGHVMGAIRGTYDKYQYLPEKAHAFEALAAMIERIVNPPADNVASLDEHRARGVS
jgi:integrase